MNKKNNIKQNYLVLKFGTVKSWNFESPEALKLLNEYSQIGHTLSTATQEDTPRQKEIICELIDFCNDKNIWLDWDGKRVSKQKAKDYVMNYGKE